MICLTEFSLPINRIDAFLSFSFLFSCFTRREGEGGRRLGEGDDGGGEEGESSSEGLE